MNNKINLIINNNNNNLRKNKLKTLKQIIQNQQII